MSPRRRRELQKTLREYVLQSASELDYARKQIRLLLKDAFALPRAPSGMKACILYLELFVNETVNTRELEIVSGIPTYARRLRQLRVEQGYDIVAERTSDGWTYLLAASKPDATRAELWKKRNTLRRMKGSGEARILAAFKAFLKQPLDIDDLAYVSRIKTARERARDLRLHKGWRIFGRHTGRQDLKVSEYVLESLDQLPPHDREIPDDVYESTLERDSYACRKCGWKPADRLQGSRRQFLEVHHKRLHSKGGSNEAKNLVTLCNMHHDEIHRKGVDEAAIDSWLKNASESK